MNSPKDVKDDDFDDLISRVYDVALEPERYEELLDTWETSVWPKINGSKNIADEIGGEAMFRHFQRADAVLERVEDNAPMKEADKLLLQFQSVAAVIISPELTVAELNPAAKNLLGIEAGSSLSSLPIEPDDRDNLTSQIGKMLRNKNPKPSIYRVRTIGHDKFFIFQMRRFLLSNNNPVVVAVTSYIRWPAGFEAILRDTFNLSGAEIAVIRLLLDCSSIKEVAEIRGRSIATIRVQIKSILEKTELHSHVELIRLVLSMIDIASAAQEKNTGTNLLSMGSSSLRALRFKTIFNSQDRRLDYLLLGDPNGSPVLYLPSEFCMVRWAASAEAEALRLGMRIIVPIRAGYGPSDPVPEGESFCRQIALDLLSVLESENVRSLPVISIAYDHYFAIEMEKVCPGTMKALIATAGGLPYSNRAQIERMHKWHRFVHAGAHFTPHLLPFIIKMGFKLARRVGVKAFVNSVYAKSDADIATIEDPEVLEALITGNKLAISDDYDSYEAFTRQTLFQKEDWLIEHVNWLNGKLPVHFLNGLQDPMVPKETLAEHQIEYDWIDFRIYPESGQLLLFQKWRNVLALVQEYIEK